MRAQLGARLAQRAGDALAPSARVRAHVLGHVNRARADLPGEVGQLALGSPAADHEARPAPAELAVEVGEALEQELGARPGRVAPVQEPVVEAEDRDDAVGLVERRPQRRVVADAEVAPQPHDRRFGQSSLATRTTSLAAVSIMSSARYSIAGAGVVAERAGELGARAGAWAPARSAAALRTGEGATGEDLAAVGDEARILADRGAAGAPELDVGLAAVAGVRCDLEDFR